MSKYPNLNWNCDLVWLSSNIDTEGISGINRNRQNWTLAISIWPKTVVGLLIFQIQLMSWNVKIYMADLCWNCHWIPFQCLFSIPIQTEIHKIIGFLNHYCRNPTPNIVLNFYMARIYCMWNVFTTNMHMKRLSN